MIITERKAKLKEIALSTLTPKEKIKAVQDFIDSEKQAENDANTLNSTLLDAIKNLDKPQTQFIGVLKGDKGEKGDQGDKPVAGVDFPLPKDGKDGKPGKDGKIVKGLNGKDGINPNPADIVPLVLEKLPAQKEIILDNGGQIVGKINDLSVDDDQLKIDASHIKNLPKEVQKHTTGFIRSTAYFDETTLVIDNPTQIKFKGAGVQLSEDSDGALVVTVAGGAAATEVYETATDSGDHTNFTISNTPNANTLLVINEDTGQIITPANYTNTTTTITFNSSLQVDNQDGTFTTPVIKAKYAY